MIELPSNAPIITRDGETQNGPGAVIGRSRANSFRDLKIGGTRSRAATIRRALGTGLAALATNLGHMLPILTHGLTALAAGLASLTRIELVSDALLVGGMPAFRGDLALLVFVHGRKP